MDSFDEFEFKPITEGLGFHKKSPLKNTERIDQLEGAEMEEILPSFRSQEEFVEPPKAKPSLGEPRVRQPLPRPGDPTNQVHTPLPSSMTGAIASGAAALGVFGAANPTYGGRSIPVPGTTTQKPEVIKRVEKKVEEHTSIATYLEPRLTPISLNLAAVVIDGIVILAMSILFLVALLIITKVDLMLVLSNMQTEMMAQISLGMLFVSVVHLYMISTRSFLGLTLGEWVFDSQLGTAAQQASVTFPLLVLWRSIFLTLTGLVIVPLLSLLVRRDIAAYVTGLNLYHRQD